MYANCDCSCVFLFKQKTAYEMRISDWSSDVCSSDLGSRPVAKDWKYEDIGRTNAIYKNWIDFGETRAATVSRRLPFHQSAWSLAEIRHRLRSEERRVGKECVSTCRARGSPSH